MPKKLKSAIEAWREAESRAKEAEAHLRASLQEFEERRGPAVPPEFVERVARLRDHAQQKLTIAVTSIGRRDDAPQAERPGDA